MLDVQKIDQFYGSSHTLRGVSLSVKQGECLALLGRNGVGKTTLLKCLMGVQPIASGKIMFDGQDISRLTPHARAALGMGYVPQGREIFPVLRTMLSRRGGDLSGGQQQQLAIARALVAEPRLIIFDEPTEGIQPSIIKDIGRVIKLLRERGDIAILLCEQYFDFARELADRFVVMSRGEVVARGNRDEMDSEEVRRHLSV